MRLIGRVLVAAAITTVACHSGPRDDDPADRATCEQLRSHIVDLRFADATGIDVRPHREAMLQSLGEGFIADCSKMTIAQAKCAIAAPNVDAASECRNDKLAH